MKRIAYAELVAAILICEFAGIIGSVFTAPAIPTWYAALQKPLLNPPSGVFAPVWTSLFALMGISLYLVWRERATDSRRIALWAFGIQLLLNVLWSVLFFGFRSPFLALIEIALLWIAIYATFVMFLRVSPPAGYLLVPYLVWVSFAIYLNAGIWTLNR